jgi:1-deoxy-D-xylulose-5-phosphate synthase
VTSVVNTFRTPPSGRLCIAFTGSLYPQALAAAAILESRDIAADLYNLRFLKPVDEDYLAAIMNQYEVMIFAEEGSRRGGFGEYASELALRRNCSCRIVALGVAAQFDALGKRDELLRRNGLDGEGIAGAVGKFAVEGLFADKGEDSLASAVGGAAGR